MNPCNPTKKALPSALKEEWLLPVSNEDVDRALTEIRQSGHKISSVRVGDGYIGVTSISTCCFYSLYSEDGLYLGMLSCELDEEKNIKGWRLRAPVNWIVKFSGTELAPEAIALLDCVALADELYRRGLGGDEIHPRRREFLALGKKAEALGIL